MISLSLTGLNPQIYLAEDHSWSQIPHQSHFCLLKFSCSYKRCSPSLHWYCHFCRSDLTQSRNVNVVFLDLLRYYDAPPFGSVWIEFVQPCSYIPCCSFEVVSLLGLFIMADVLPMWIFPIEYMGNWQSFIKMHKSFPVACALLSFSKKVLH